MIDQDSYWEQRLSRHPFPRQRFTQEMMTNVEERLQHSSRRRSNNLFLRTAVVITALVMLMLVPGLWSIVNIEIPAGPDQTGPEQIDQPPPPPPAEQEPEPEPETLKRELNNGIGGNISLWERLDAASFREVDQTMIEFIRALLRRELGAMGGPSVPADRLWEDPESKRVLEIYELSSPWVSVVHVEQIKELEESIRYTLRLTLTETSLHRFREELQVRISLETNLIEEVQIVDDGTGRLPPKDIETFGLAEDPEHQLSLYSFLFPDEGEFYGITVFYKEQMQHFDHWWNTANETYYPEVWVTDLTGDGEEEIAILLTTGYGAGYLETEMKVLDNTLTEIPVLDPVSFAEDLVSTTLEQTDESRTYTLELNGEERTFVYDEDASGLWFDTAVFGNIIRYQLEDDTIYAEIPAQISVGIFPLSVMIRYDYVDGAFTPMEAFFAAEL